MERFEATVLSAVVYDEGTVQVEIVTGPAAAPPSVDGRMKILLPFARARLFPAGAKVMVTLEPQP